MFKIIYWENFYILFFLPPQSLKFHEVKKTPHVDPMVLHYPLNLLLTSWLKSTDQAYGIQIQNYAIKNVQESKTHGKL